MEGFIPRICIDCEWATYLVKTGVAEGSLDFAGETHKWKCRPKKINGSSVEASRVLATRQESAQHVDDHRLSNPKMVCIGMTTFA